MISSNIGHITAMIKALMCGFGRKNGDFYPSAALFRPNGRFFRFVTVFLDCVKSRGGSVTVMSEAVKVVSEAARDLYGFVKVLHAAVKPRGGSVKALHAAEIVVYETKKSFYGMQISQRDLVIGSF